MRLPSFFRDLTHNVRWVDVIDVALIALFIYSALIWFRRTASRSVVVGIFLLAMLYVLARRFDMYLTLLLFHTVFAVLLIALVVVFQEEIRRGFERVAVWGSFRDRRRQVAHPGVDTLLEGISTLASNRMGALLVIRGREPLDRHVEGGIPLHGRISKPLLYSIFDPHSPGHDGAVLIEADRVTKFGAHLPLSKNLRQIGTLGTRHSAALGMSECSDAFVIVVSEERGTIGVAQEGRLLPMSSVAELKDRLERFYAAQFPRQVQSLAARLFRQNARLKVAALALALTGWFLFAYRAETIERSFTVPVEYRNLSAGWHLEGRKPEEVRVTLSGSERAFHLLNPGALLISLDLGSLQEGMQRITISEENLRKPAGLEVERIDPNVILLEARRVKGVSLPVEVQTVGEVHPPARLVSLKVLPATVRVQVAESHLAVTKKLLTEPVDLSPIRQTTLLPVKLLLPEEVRLADTELPEVRVMVELAGETVPFPGVSGSTGESLDRKK